jgi:hypothetical protein
LYAKKADTRYERFFRKYAGIIPGFKMGILDSLPDTFTERQVKTY